MNIDNMENIGQIDIEKLTYEEAFDMMKALV
ncbi:MAG: exodeoxyribonuclease VII small subunit, partial [Peptostreptococcus sp.]|nr:exodeoxyribonuclease VII small subunit [Peptostreptococcus sp.]